MFNFYLVKKKKLLILLFLFILADNELQKIISNYKTNNYNYFYSNERNNIKNISFKDNNIKDIKSLILQLNFYQNNTKRNNIIFADYYLSKICYDKSAFSLFEYYLKNNIDIPYYIINSESDFYKSLIRKNQTRNLILYNSTNLSTFYQSLFNYLKDTKIIVNAYSIYLMQYIAGKVPYIKYLKINHGIKHFKELYAKTEFIKELGDKKNVICSSPIEYELYTKVLKYKSNQIYNASLSRYERFKYIKKNYSESKCILASFTYRSYNRYIFEKSEYKKNLDKFLNNKKLIKFLHNKKIELIYIPHHREVELGKNYLTDTYKYSKILNQSNLEHCIERCSLFITDFSSLSFDFMFQNKPVLFYSIDKNDNNSIIEKQFMRESNDTIYFGNFFSNQNLLINKIKYYINNNFNIGNDLQLKYESVFHFKENIHKRLSEIINIIINKRKIVSKNLLQKKL